MKDTLKIELTALLKSFLNSDNKLENKEVCQKIYKLLITEFDFDLTQNKTVKTHHGKALDAMSTAKTLLLNTRNKKYLQAILKKLTGKEEVLYLGTGPFAPFLLFPVLLGCQAKFTLLEINEYSIDVLEKMIQRFQLSDSVLEVVKTDSALWKTDRSYDLVIGGINDMSMRHEDSFEIHKNIVKQLPEAQYIPKNIELYLKQADKVDYYDSLLSGIEKGYLRTDCPYPKELRPILQTKVIVDEDLVLEPGESIITGSTYFYS